MPGSLTPEHQAHLEAHAVKIDLALSLGVYSVTSAGDLPEGRQSGLGRHVPGILFPWTSPGGHVEYQLKPDEPAKDNRGRLKKYVFRSKKQGYQPVLWAARPQDNASDLLIVEGTKQTLAAASWADERFAVYGIGGCRMWSSEGLPIGDLSIVADRHVTIILDADAAGNANVYGAGEKLKEALDLEGAASVSFARLPGKESDGLDDVLATRSEDTRTQWLNRLVKGSKSKPADKKPRSKSGEDPDKFSDDERPAVVVNGDPKAVRDGILQAMAQRWDGDAMFNYGSVISRRRAAELIPMNKGEFADAIYDAVVPIAQDNQGNVSYRVPPQQVVDAMMSKADLFSPLDRVAQAPFIRPDGSVCQKSGYDPESRTYLHLDPQMEGIKVPMKPTKKQVAQAVELLSEEWLGDYTFGDDASRANVLGLVLTPLIRGHVPVVPLAVIDGVQFGVGKNLLADCVTIVATGKSAEPMNLPDDDDEVRKSITAAYRGGREIFVWDEAHEIKGVSVAKALTEITRQDRILGASKVGSFPNNVTWMALGNQVKVYGDCIRRVYRIFIKPADPNPQDRSASDFRHPDLRTWTSENRDKLLEACLTLIRAWFVAGKPNPSRVNFGSFETWQRIVGGILEHAGIPGFLNNITEWRSESDFYSQYWVSHLSWLRGTFGDTKFSTSTVRQEAMSDLGNFCAPPNLDDPAEKSYSKKLGEAYARIKERRFDGLYLVKAGTGHNHINQWMVVDESGNDPEPEPDDTVTVEPDGDGDEAQNVTVTEPPRQESQGEELTSGVVFDIETAEAQKFRTYGDGFLRLGGYAGRESGTPILTGDMAHLSDTIRDADMVSGHNIMSFDLPALVEHSTLTMEDIHRKAKAGQLRDGLLIERQLDPPMARDKSVAGQRKYDLDSLGQRFELGGKTGDLKALAKEFGGYDQIPTDDDRYRTYLSGDIELSRDLDHHQDERMTQRDRDYLHKEHRIAAIAAQLTHNGFLVNQPLLAEMVQKGEDRKWKALHRLAKKYGLPLEDAKGKPFKAPLSSKAGKQRLCQLFEERKVRYWTTPNSGDIMLTSDAMRRIAEDYATQPDVVEIARLVNIVVTTRSVYTTIRDNMVDGRVHPNVSMGQSTGRWSLTSPGLTVMGKRGGRHKERHVLTADPGHTLIAVDLSQVDMRAVAGLSQDQAYIDMLKSEDPHMEVSKALFGDEAHREESKAIGHGWNYGRGVKAIAMGEEIDAALVMKFDREMKENFPRLVEWREEVREQAASGALLENGWGRMMRPDPARAHTQGPALMGQGGARDIMMHGMVTIADKLPECLPMLRAQVHDEIVLSVPADDAVEIEREIIRCLSFEWHGVPIVADGGSRGFTWGDCYEK